jgi:hypothetical protein
MGGRVLVNPLSLTLCWLGTVIFDKQEIIVSATDPIVEEAWDKVVKTLLTIERTGLKQHQMVNLTRRLLLVLNTTT